MADLKLYQIPRSVLAKEPKPIVQIDFPEELAKAGQNRQMLETPESLALINGVANTLVTALGYVGKVNYGVVSVFDKIQWAEYESLLEQYRMDAAAIESMPSHSTAKSVRAGKDKVKKKK